MLEERRTLLQWALGAIAELEVNYASVARKTGSSGSRGDIANQEVDRLRERIESSAADGPRAAHRLFAKLVSRS